jgi:Putative auto-transporter adhesin, head GIN domain
MRSKLDILSVGLISLSIFAGCLLKLGSIRGSGIVKTESREVTGFSSISLKSVGGVKVQQTGKEFLAISAEDNILPLLESRVKDRVLCLSIVNDSSFDLTKPIEFALEVKSLECLNIDGVGSIEAKGIQAKRLAVSLDGVGSMAISGSVDVLDLNLSGVGSFQGREFKTKQTVVRSRGVGSAVVNASEYLDADLSGIGSVEYLGSPQVRESVRGLGRLKKR